MDPLDRQDDDELHLDERGPRERVRWNQPQGKADKHQDPNQPHFQKCFVDPNKQHLDPQVVDAYRKKHEVYCKSGRFEQEPWMDWKNCAFNPTVLAKVQEKHFDHPTPIQAQVFPIIMSGVDLIGIAQTGSGKTIGYLFPAIEHIQAQQPLQRGDGPVILILSPTRELGNQINEQVQCFAGACKLRSACIYGGVPKQPQSNQLYNGVEIIVATPGRLLDFLDSKETNLDRVTYLVIDEADRMLDMGFEPQVRRIVDQIRSDRQTVFFSATWPHEVQTLALDFCHNNPVHIQIGRSNLTINKDINQTVILLHSHQKFSHLVKILDKLYSNDKVLIFAERKSDCEMLTRNLCSEDYFTLSLHGDKTQVERDRVMAKLKLSDTRLVCATDLASRGLDVSDITMVINYDFPTQFDSYIHRIGRTGRAGAKGRSVSFIAFDKDDPRVASKLVKLMRAADIVVPEDLVAFSSGNFNPTMVNRIEDYKPKKPLLMDSYQERNQDRSYNNRPPQGDRNYNNRGPPVDDSNFYSSQHSRIIPQGGGYNTGRGNNNNDRMQQRNYDNERPQQNNGQYGGRDRYQDDNQRGGGYNNRPDTDYQRGGNRRFDDRGSRPDNNNDRGGYNNPRGDQNNDRGGRYNNERGGGYNNDRNQGNNNDRNGGFIDNRSNNDRGGYNNDRRGGYNNDRGGGYNAENRGGYNNNDRGGGYNAESRGGYNNNDRGSGGYNNNDRGSGFNGRNNYDRGGNDRGGNDRGDRGGFDRGGNDRGGNDRGGNQRFNDRGEQGIERNNERDQGRQEQDRGQNQRFSERNNDRGNDRGNDRNNDRNNNERGGNQRFSERQEADSNRGNVRFSERGEDAGGRQNTRFADRNSDNMDRNADSRNGNGVSGDQDQRYSHSQYASKHQQAD